MKKLHLVLKGKWYDMIDSGVKTEEYRDKKQFWFKRLVGQGFDVVEFQHGYSKNAKRMTFELTEIVFATGNPDWGAEAGKEYFVIKLGKRL